VALCDIVGFTDRGDITKGQLEDAFKRVYQHIVRVMAHPMLREERLLQEAETFFEMLAQEWQWSPERLQQRLLEVRMEVSTTGTYTHTSEEIEQEHLKLATGGTNLLSVMTVFRPRHPNELVGLRFWNSQFVRYAGYEGEGEGGGVLGDPANAEFTKHLIDKGLWRPPAQRSAFDVLPLVVQLPEQQEPFVYELPREFVHQAPITHPRFPAFQELGLRWPTVPAITNFEMVLGGVYYTCLPFNGWFMELEVVRNLIERYKISEKVAAIIGAPTTEKLWQGRVLQETAVAVLHSFEAAKFTMVDQYTAQASFLTHCQRERSAGRECPAQWQWIGGLVGPGLNPLWHLEMRDFKIAGPEYRYCCDLWSTQDTGGGEVHAATIDPEAAAAAPVAQRPRVLILYGSETGTAESVAGRCARTLRLLRPTLAPLNDYADEAARKALAQRFDTLLVITSTFGTGQPPGNAAKFAAQPLPAGCLAGVQHAVCALGSSARRSRPCSGSGGRRRRRRGTRSTSPSPRRARRSACSTRSCSRTATWTHARRACSPLSSPRSRPTRPAITWPCSP
jgi:nitric oxide synthase oxygenase domain/subunit/flavodoxin